MTVPSYSTVLVDGALLLSHSYLRVSHQSGALNVSDYLIRIVVGIGMPLLKEMNHELRRPPSDLTVSEDVCPSHGRDCLSLSSLVWK